MNKKLNIVVLMLVLVIMVFTACGKKAEDKTTDPGIVKDNSETETKTDTSTNTNTDTPKDDEPKFEFEKREIKFGTTSAESTIVVQTMKLFSEKVAAATNGNVDVQIYPGSQLGSVSEMVQSAQLGAIDMSMSQPSTLADLGAKEMGVLGLPYLFTSFEQRWKVLYGEIGQDLLEAVAPSGTGLVGFGYFADGARSFFTTEGNPIRSLADVKGMKLRVMDTVIDNDYVIALGGSPTPTSSSEMYSALQTGIVNGAEQPIAAYYANKYYEVSDFLTLDEHTYNTLVIVFSEKIWDTLSPELQEVLVNCWNEAANENKQLIIDTEAELLEKIADEGVEIIRLTDTADWVAAMDSVYTKHAGNLQEYIDRIKGITDQFFYRQLYINLGYS